MNRVLLPLVMFIVTAVVWFTFGLYVGDRGSEPAFNDGFSDSKLDDCQQGFQPACDWLKHTK